MDITITIPDQHIQRVAAMVRSKLPTDIDPDTEEPYVFTNEELIVEFKRMITRYIKGEVQQYELLEQHKAVFDSYTPLEPTTD